jgi:hypothetical protein
MPERWEPVEQFEVEVPPDDLVAEIESVAPTGQRYQSEGDARAIVIPGQSLPAGWIPRSALPASARIVFVDPPDGSTANGLLSSARVVGSVWVALPPGTSAMSLVEEPGRRVVVPVSGVTTVLGLFRAPQAHGESREELADAPRVGESTDVVDQRSAWFDVRESQ